MKALKPIIAVPLKYGAIVGVFLFLVFFGMQLAGQQPGINVNTMFIQGLLIVLFMYFCLREFRDYKNGGILHYWQGMTASFILYALAALLYASAMWVWLTVDAEAMQQIIYYRLGHMQRTKESFIQGGGTEEVFNTQVAQLKLLTPGVMFIDQLVRTLFIGVLTAVLPSIILRKKPPGE